MLAAIAWVHDAWPAALLVVSGSFLTSYNKARAAMEIAIDNADWPDLFERLERVIFIVALLAIARFLPIVPGTDTGAGALPGSSCWACSPTPPRCSGSSMRARDRGRE